MGLRVLIYEPIYWGGHNLMYVRQLVRTLRNWPVSLELVTGAGAERSATFETQIRPHLADFAEVRCSIPQARPGDDWGRHYYDHLVDAIDDVAPDHVFIPSGDIIAAFAGSRRLRGALRRPKSEPTIDCNVIGMFYRSDLPMSEKPKRLRSSIYASFAPWGRICTNDPFVSAGELPWRWLHGLVPEVIPDPIDAPVVATREAARQALGLPQDVFIVGCTGHFASHERKNPIGLIQGFLESRASGEGIVALLGQMSPDLVKFVDSLGPARSRVHRVNRFLSDDEMQLAIVAMDLVCLPYQDFYHPSGITLCAAALGRPVLTSNTGWFQSVVPRFKLGWTADLSDASKIARALDSYRGPAESFSPSEPSRMLARFLRWENYVAVFARRLRLRLGVAADPAEIGWDDVVAAVASSHRFSTHSAHAA